MKIKVYVLDFEMPRTLKRALIGASALVATIWSALVYASVPNTFNANDPISSSKTITNLSSLDTRVNTLEVKPSPAQALSRKAKRNC